jgi:predicted Zn-ribbon and HTH transcriptional regulator
MGRLSIYKCKECGYRFIADVGGSSMYKSFRCVTCDQAKAIVFSDIPQYMHKAMGVVPSPLLTLEDIGQCLKCGGKLDEDLGPMCPNCKSRSVIRVKVLLWYD